MDKIKAVDYRQLLEERHYKLDYEPVEEHKILTIQEKVVGTAGNFMILSGLPKAGKSTFLHAIISSSFMANKNIYGISLQPDKRQCIGYFDTESAEYDFYRNIKRIRTFCNMYSLPSTFNMFTTREDNCETNKALVEAYIKTGIASVVIIDGLLDLIVNYNDEAESRRLIDWLKRITSQNKVLIIGVIHTGKKDNHTLGHFGSMADRYAQSVLEVVKEKETSTIQLWAKYMRSDREFDPIYLGWTGSEYVEVGVPKKESGPPDKRRSR